MLIGPDDVVHQPVGDVRFRAPEVVSDKPYNLQADTWSFGILFYYILTKTLPFQTKKQHYDPADQSIIEDMILN